MKRAIILCILLFLFLSLVLLLIAAKPVTLYAPNDRTMKAAPDHVEEYLEQGWYRSPVVPLPPELADPGITHDIPAICVTTKDGAAVTSGTDYVPCAVTVCNVGGEYALEAAAADIRVRGNASSFHGNEQNILTHRVPYRIKFKEKQGMLGLNDDLEAKSWVLLTNGLSTTAVYRNEIAFRIAHLLMDEDGIYCSDFRYVHLYLNGQWKGLYLLAEQNQVNEHRVDVNEPDEDQVETNVGYFVEIDSYREEPWFPVGYAFAEVKDVRGQTGRFAAQSYSIKSDVSSNAQKSFIAGYMQKVFRILYRACEENNYQTFDSNYSLVKAPYTNAKDTVAAVVNLDSFVDMYILYELMDDYDMGVGSFYFCTDLSDESKHPKLEMTAPWDFDWTCSGKPAGSLRAASFCQDLPMHSYNPWFIVLYKQDWFRDMVRDKWTEIGGSEGIEACIAQEQEELDRSQADLDELSAAEANLDWLTRRARWLDKLWLRGPLTTAPAAAETS